MSLIADRVLLQKIINAGWNFQKTTLKKWLVFHIPAKLLFTIHFMLRLLIYYIPCLLFIPIIIFVRLARPLILIRFGPIRSDRIGHFAGNTEIYLCERKGRKGRILDFCYLSHPPCNKQLMTMWKRLIYIHPLVRWLAIANKAIPGSRKHTIEMKTDRDDHGYLSRFGAHLNFTPQEEAIGKRYLKSRGINEGDKFICFITRDERYLKERAVKFSSSSKSMIDWSYHNYRNSSIEPIVPSVEKLIEMRGYHAFRMGYLVEEKIKTNNPKIIDYANNGDRSDFLDIYLAAKCHLFITSGSGFYAVPLIFRKNIVVVNLIPVGYTGGRCTYFIPKKLRWKDKKQLVTFREILTPPGLQFLRSDLYEKSGLEWINNTPEEISDVVMEAILRIENKWEPSKKDEDLHQKCKSIFSDYAKRYEIAARSSYIGTQFLRNNQILLK